MKLSILSLASAGECGTIDVFWGEQQATGTLVSVVCHLFPKRRLSPLLRQRSNLRPNAGKL